jgi:hypothetical protein
MVVVMPGLSDFAFDYASKMGDWFSKNRKDGKWPCDIINYHHYSNTGNKLKQYPPQWKDNGACLPADDENFVSVRNIVYGANFAGKKVWITEIGADTLAPSMMLANGVGKSHEDFQAEIITESLKGVPSGLALTRYLYSRHTMTTGPLTAANLRHADFGQVKQRGTSLSPPAKAVKKFIAGLQMLKVLRISKTPRTFESQTFH